MEWENCNVHSYGRKEYIKLHVGYQYAMCVVEVILFPRKLIFIIFCGYC